VGQSIGVDCFEIWIGEQDQPGTQGVNPANDIRPGCAGYSDHCAAFLANRRCDALETLELPYTKYSPMAPVKKDQGVALHF
jgi:hypothetical protein